MLDLLLDVLLLLLGFVVLSDILVRRGRFLRAVWRFCVRREERKRSQDLVTVVESWGLMKTSIYTWSGQRGDLLLEVSCNPHTSNRGALLLVPPVLRIRASIVRPEHKRWRVSRRWTPTPIRILLHRLFGCIFRTLPSNVLRALSLDSIRWPVATTVPGARRWLLTADHMTSRNHLLQSEQLTAVLNRSPKHECTLVGGTAYVTALSRVPRVEESVAAIEWAVALAEVAGRAQRGLEDRFLDATHRQRGRGLALHH